ncbi:MAG: hypothetical protein EBU81_14020 [Proteobacteria bacterium]|nr:hypothetical protein [Pseudomonadota bacterium]
MAPSWWMFTRGPTTAVPAKSAGISAEATRRAGGVQKGSPAAKACRLMRRNAVAAPASPTASQ